MKANFDRSGVTAAVLGLVFAADVICVFVFLFALFSVNLTSITVYGILTLIFTVCVVALCSLHGSVIADEKATVIVSVLFGKTVRKKVIDYSNIKNVKCGVESHGMRYGNVVYEMVLTITTVDELEAIFLKRLNIETDFPASEPDKYKQYLHDQPLMKISHYIDSKLHLNTSA
ncbi:MAG: hypothetical protein K2J72_09430 [Oscillospiraceae bacterium]|nr:hypothetical protein [Oscillospiraceae bacterium]